MMVETGAACAPEKRTAVQEAAGAEALAVEALPRLLLEEEALPLLQLETNWFHCCLRRGLLPVAASGLEAAEA